jgi:long-chain acyl-CoA synthetase
MHQGIVHFPELFFHQVDRLKVRVALRNKDYGIWKRISWNEYGQMVRQVAAGLMALGVERGDRVAILGENRPEWLACHLGTMSSGGVTCGVYPTSAPDQVAYVASHSEAKVLFIENEEQVDKVLQILPDLEAVRQIIVWDPKGLWGFSQDKIIFFDQFMKEAQSFLEKNPRCIENRLTQIEADDTAMIIYTSGTTGRPKGAMISHRNILGMTESFVTVNKGFESDEVVSYLPLAHIYENLISLFQAI